MKAGWILATLAVICRGMPGLEEVPLFHYFLSVWCESVRVSTGPHVLLIRVTQQEGCQWIPELARGVVATQEKGSRC